MARIEPSAQPKRLMTECVCSVEGCDRLAWTKGMCGKHYQRLKNTGTTDARIAEAGEALRFLESHVAYERKECLVFPYVRDRLGYGKIDRWRGAGSSTASRVMCILAHGEPPFPKAEAAHSCGKGHEGCVNPTHLRWATRKENMEEASRQGAMHRAVRARSAKITEQQAAEIRTDKRKQTEIAAQYGIHPSIVSEIKSGKRWRILHSSERGA